MAKKIERENALSLLRQSPRPLSLSAIAEGLNHTVPDRTLRRWLIEWVQQGQLQRTGVGRATRYQYTYHNQSQWSDSNANAASEFYIREPLNDSPDTKAPLLFLQGLDTDLQTGLLNQLRDLWTHSSTALEGNTLSLGDTHFILQEGLTISGKPIKDHKEVIGHANAIKILYQCLAGPLTENHIFELHRAVQTEVVYDICRPIGNWKNEINGTYAIDKNGQQLFIEYAMPITVPKFMTELIDYINTVDIQPITAKHYSFANKKDFDIKTYAEIYAKVHMGIVHIHPFFDGNGRIARLLANIPLLKAGLPPLIISQQQRRSYIQTLANYQIAVGQLNQKTGVWPQPELLNDFTAFCISCFEATEQLLNQAFALQAKRNEQPN